MELTPLIPTPIKDALDKLNLNDNLYYGTGALGHVLIQELSDIEDYAVTHVYLPLEIQEKAQHAMEFAEWTSKNGWLFLEQENLWTELHEASSEAQYITMTELYQLFTNKY